MWADRPDRARPRRRAPTAGAGAGGRSGIVRAAAVLAVVCVAAAGCAGGFLSGGSPFERSFESGRYDAAVEAFEQDSALQRREEPLFRMGLLRATPDRPYYDPDRARELLESLLELHPTTRFRAYAEGVLALVDRADQVSSRVATLEARLEAARDRSDSLRLELREAGARVDSLERELAETEELEAELAEARERAARLEKQLDQLKRVHLGQPPDTAGGGSPR